MDLREARIMTMDLMEEHGVDYADFEWMTKRTRLGEVQVSTFTKHTTLRLNRQITRLSEREHVRQTVLHEIAHILAGVEHHHDRVWKMTARAIGYTGERTSSVPEEHTETAPWIGVCPNGHISGRSRQPKRTQSCGKCSRRFDSRYVITWTRREEYHRIVKPARQDLLAAARSLRSLTEQS